MHERSNSCTDSPLDLSGIVPPALGWGPGQVEAGGLPVPPQEQRGVYLPIPDSLSNDPAALHTRCRWLPDHKKKTKWSGRWVRLGSEG